MSVISGFIIFSNGMAAIVSTVTGLRDEMNFHYTENTDPMSFFFSNYLEMCLIMVSIGVAYLIGGIFLRKYKLWANYLVTGLSVILILLIWALMISMAMSAGKEEGMEIFKYGAIINAFFWSTPLAFLIFYLNKQKIKKHFV